jgi:hypothetical protein
MNRLLGACLIGVFGALGMGCAVTGVGDPCIPEDEFNPKFSQSVAEDLVIDVNSVQCETRVCLRHYFRGRVSCPFGNNARGQQIAGAECKQVSGRRGLYTLTGEFSGDLTTLCCPVLGDMQLKPVNEKVDPQCEERKADKAVYCSCRCAVPDDPDIDKSKVTLCDCPTGYSCKALCDQKTGNCSLVPKGKWGSYCVKDGPAGANFNPAQADAQCRTDVKP